MMAGQGNVSARSMKPSAETEDEWIDWGEPLLIVWAEDDRVVIYDNERDRAGRRWIMTPDEALALARLLGDAARIVAKKANRRK
jgi:hypothetical protein